ncbi:uncharacterized protein LOC144344701 [Saccoglossus kowalevskii]
MKENTDEHVIIECTPNGYSFKHNPRNTSSGGGIALIYKSSLKLSTWKPITNIKSFEATEATLIHQGIALKLVILYRPPPSVKNKLNVSQFLLEFGAMLEKYGSYNGNLFIVGDFNLHIDDQPNSTTHKFTNIIDSCNLKQWVHDPTHIRRHILDLVITNSDVIDSISIDSQSLSDHRPVHAQLLLQKPPLIRRQICYRCISSISSADFSKDIATIQDLHQQPSDLNSAVTTYNSAISCLLNKYAPIKKRIITARPDTKWYTAELNQAKKHLLERIVASQLTDYLTANSLLEPLQSAYRKYHSTETALLKIHNDICSFIDSGNYVLLCLLDLSAAFDTIDHNILLNRLSNLGVTDMALQWFESYLQHRCQSVSVSSVTSEPSQLHFGVPQGSVLGPILFTIYISPLGKLIRQHNLDFHQYSDDNQLYHAFTRKDSISAVASIEACTLDIKHWMTQNKLQLNDSKTEVLLIRSKLTKLPDPIDKITICTSSLAPVTSAHNMGVTFDNTHSCCSIC